MPVAAKTGNPLGTEVVEFSSNAWVWEQSVWLGPVWDSSRWRKPACHRKAVPAPLLQGARGLTNPSGVASKQRKLSMMCPYLFIPSTMTNNFTRIVSEIIRRAFHTIPSVKLIPPHYQALLCACASGAPGEWDAVPLGGSRPLTDPQSGLAFEMEGTDSQQLMIPPAPSVASAQRAGEMVEDYWMALLRDVPVTSFFDNTLAQCACADLNKLSDFRGPKVGSKVTPGTLFRGFTSGDLMGPYVSQFFLKSFNFGASRLDSNMKHMLLE
jgi:hypothetical protein